MTTTQIGKLTKLIPYPSSLSNYNNYNITVSYHILIVLKIIAVQPVIVKHYTGLFISPFGISGLCDAVTGMVTPKGSMSTEGETLQFSVLPYRCSICPRLVTRQMSNLAILAESKTQNASLFPVHAMFRHDCPLTV